tara:strand:- start:317 stop:1240 length:924 start_codon:yes stop_codon:yes gene_type:complete
MKKLFTILVIIFCTLLKLDVAYDNPLPKVMVVISDKSISKYNEAARGFVESIPYDPQVVEIGVFSKKKIKSIRKMIKKNRPDLLYCIGSKAMDTICMDFPKIPSVFSSAINWQKFKLPEKANGIAAKVSVEMQITLFRFIFPSIKRIGVIYSPKYNEEWFLNAKQTAASLGVDLSGAEFYKSDSIEKTVQDLVPAVDSLWLIPDPLVITRKSIPGIFSYFENVKKPVFAYSEAFIGSGAMLAVSDDSATIGRQAAGIALDILDGRKLTNKVQNPAGSHITLNLGKANEYKLEVNRVALGSINRIIRE